MEYSARANSDTRRARLHCAHALEGSRDTNDDLQASANKYLKAIFKPAGIDASTVKITSSYSNTCDSTVAVNGQVDAPTAIKSALGYDIMTVTHSSTVRWSSTRLVALALDNTGSMAEAGKMDALKKATSSLLNQPQSAANSDGDVYVSIIPFNKDVNVGSEDKDQNWIDWSLGTIQTHLLPKDSGGDSGLGSRASGDSTHQFWLHLLEDRHSTVGRSKY